MSRPRITAQRIAASHCGRLPGALGPQPAPRAGGGRQRGTLNGVAACKCLLNFLYSKTISVFERALQLTQTGDLQHFSPRYRALVGHAYALSGHFTEARTLLEQALEQGASGGPAVSFGVKMSEGLMLVGCLEEASALAQKDLELRRTRQEHGIQAWVLRLLGEIAMHRNPPEVEPATTHYEQALTLATELGMRPLQAHCHRELGALYQQTGQSEQTHAELSTAIDMYRDMQMTFWLPETEAVVAQC